MRVTPDVARHTGARDSATGRWPETIRRRIAGELEAAATAREVQLRSLPVSTTPVAVAHRDSVERILGSIRAAQAQLEAGTYGDCHRCGLPADPEAGLVRPWAPLCASCARR